MPQICRPCIWLHAVSGLTIVPAAKAPTMRGARISRVSAWIRTSTNWAPKAKAIASFGLGAAGQRRLALVEARPRSGGTPSGTFSA